MLEQFSRSKQPQLPRILLPNSFCYECTHSIKRWIALEKANITSYHFYPLGSECSQFSASHDIWVSSQNAEYQRQVNLQSLHFRSKGFTCCFLGMLKVPGLKFSYCSREGMEKEETSIKIGSIKMFSLILDWEWKKSLEPDGKSEWSNFVGVSNCISYWTTSYSKIGSVAFRSPVFWQLPNQWLGSKRCDHTRNAPYFHVLQKYFLDAWSAQSMANKSTFCINDSHKHGSVAHQLNQLSPF